MDLFKKCEAHMLADELRDQGIYPYGHALESRPDAEVVMEGKRRIMLGSNNYLGLTAHPAVLAAGNRNEYIYRRKEGLCHAHSDISVS